MRMTGKAARCALMLLVAIVLMALAVPGLVAAATDPIGDLTAAVAYWQEQALTAAVERDRLREQVTRITAERDVYLRDRTTLEEIVARLRSERDEAMTISRSEAALRQQAEHDLTVAIQTIASLQTALKQLAGPRFGLILGATYDIRAGDPGVMAALQLTFK